jgi:tetratricopeptide (TPR) repeat protein
MSDVDLTNIEILMNSGEFEGAISTLLELCESDPNYWVLSYLLACCCYELGEYKNSMKYYELSEECLYKEAEHYAKSEEEMINIVYENGEKIANVKPEFLALVYDTLRSSLSWARIMTGKGNCYLATGQFQEAIERFGEAIDMTPDGVNYSDPHEGLRTASDRMSLC